MCLPALSESVVTEMQDELMKRVWLFVCLLLPLFLKLGLLLDTHTHISTLPD